MSVENASLHEAVERQAVTDELTGLANVRASSTRSTASWSGAAASARRSGS